MLHRFGAAAGADAMVLVAMLRASRRAVRVLPTPFQQLNSAALVRSWSHELAIQRILFRPTTSRSPCRNSDFLMPSKAAAVHHQVKTASEDIAPSVGGPTSQSSIPSILNAAGAASNFDDAVIKPKRKQSSMCQHGRKACQCRQCGGSGFCAHGKLKSRCRACGGSSFCCHGRKRAQCKECKGSGLCVHLRQKSQCRDCCSFKKLGQLLESGIIPELNPQQPRLETDWESLGNNLFRCMCGTFKP